MRPRVTLRGKMVDLERVADEEVWKRLADHEREQFGNYVDMLVRDPEAICTEFNPSRRQEFVRLLAKGLGL